MDAAMQSIVQSMQGELAKQSGYSGFSTGGNPRMKQDFEAFIKGDKDAPSRLYSYFVLDRRYDTNVNDSYERIIARSCRDSMLSTLVTEEAVTGNATILYGLACSVKDKVKDLGLELTQLAEVYFRFPTKDPLKETELQRQVRGMVDTLFETDNDKLTIAKLFVQPKLKNHKVITYPKEIYFSDRIVWKEPLEFAKSVSSKAESFKVKLLKVQGQGLVAKDSNGLSDPYFEASVADKIQFKSSIKKKTLNPEWDMSQEKHDTIKAKGDNTIQLTMFDKDPLTSEFMGLFEFSLSRVYALQEVGLESPMDSVTVVLKPDATKKRTLLKDTWDFTVSGTLAVTLHISKE